MRQSSKDTDEYPSNIAKVFQRNPVRPEADPSKQGLEDKGVRVLLLLHLLFPLCQFIWGRVRMSCSTILLY